VGARSHGLSIYPTRFTVDSHSTDASPRLILASASPRRQELLREAGYAFVVIPADIDESVYPPELAPDELAKFLATAKANVVADQFREDVILAADTVVALDTQTLGKPIDADDARCMLRLLSGTTHCVTTGVAVVQRSRKLALHSRVTSHVQMRSLTESEIEAYVATNAWQGKAGGYGIQDADPFVTRMSGCHTNIVGLPMDEAVRMLIEAGISPQTAS
jgi:septum formation protein